MYDSEVGRDIRLSFKALAENGTGFTDADALLLRRRINAAVDELRSRGWPVERIIVRMKELAWEVGLRLGHNVHDVDRHPALAQAVKWCVERYYEDNSLTADPSSLRSSG